MNNEYDSDYGATTLLLCTGDGCDQGTFPSIPGDLWTLEQI